jgi:hypothetical protein
VSTPPPVSEPQLAAALARIAQRRREADDELFATVDSEDPRRVLHHILAHTSILKHDAAQADFFDGQLLHCWLQQESRLDELRLYKRADLLKIARTRQGARRGIGSQGVQDRKDALQAWKDRGRLNAKLTREVRQAEHARLHAAEPNARWLARNHDWLVSVATALSQRAHAIASDDTYEFLQEVRRDLRTGQWSASSVTMMAATADALEAQPEVAALAGQHLLRRTLAEVRKLDLAFTNLEGLPAITPRRTPPPPRTKKAAAAKKKGTKKAAGATKTTTRTRTATAGRTPNLTPPSRHTANQAVTPAPIP